MRWWTTAVFAALPVCVYLLLVRPKFDHMWLTSMIIGIVMALLSLIPLGNVPFMLMFIIWYILTIVLLIAHAIVWLAAAEMKKCPFVAGAVMTGVTFLLSCACLGNWPAAVAALCYLVSLFFVRYKF